MAEIFVQFAINITVTIYQGHIHLNNICKSLIVALCCPQKCCPKLVCSHSISPTFNRSRSLFSARDFCL